MIQLAKNICLGAALFTSTAAFAEDSGWAISEADGQVTVIRADKAIYGAEGTQLQIGDVVRTSKAAQAILVRDTEFVVVAPDEQVRIAKMEEAGTVTKVIQFLGNMFAADSAQSNVKPPKLAAVVKGYGEGKDSETNSALESLKTKPYHSIGE